MSSPRQSEAKASPRQSNTAMEQLAINAAKALRLSTSRRRPSSASRPADSSRTPAAATSATSAAAAASAASTPAPAACTESAAVSTPPPSKPPAVIFTATPAPTTRPARPIRRSHSAAGCASGCTHEAPRSLPYRIQAAAAAACAAQPSSPTPFTPTPPAAAAPAAATVASLASADPTPAPLSSAPSPAFAPFPPLPAPTPTPKSHGRRIHRSHTAGALPPRAAAAQQVLHLELTSELEARELARRVRSLDIGDVMTHRALDSLSGGGATTAGGRHLLTLAHPVETERALLHLAQAGLCASEVPARELMLRLAGRSADRLTSLASNRRWGGTPVAEGARAVPPAISPRGPTQTVDPLTWRETGASSPPARSRAERHADEEVPRSPLTWEATACGGGGRARRHSDLRCGDSPERRRRGGGGGGGGEEEGGASGEWGVASGAYDPLTWLPCEGGGEAARRQSFDRRSVRLAAWSDAFRSARGADGKLRLTDELGLEGDVEGACEESSPSRTPREAARSLFEFVAPPAGQALDESHASPPDTNPDEQAKTRRSIRRAAWGNPAVHHPSAAVGGSSQSSSNPLTWGRPHQPFERKREQAASSPESPRTTAAGISCFSPDSVPSRHARKEAAELRFTAAASGMPKAVQGKRSATFAGGDNPVRPRPPIPLPPVEGAAHELKPW
ncbi:hypothetical protein AB1Y20_013105 [Prymnesium parvum]|uniref:Uncharacterized protein n=1 Tax=Prymnesium parvum TaxID=97485 RepID=A0AB34IKH5_PRYPA